MDSLSALRELPPLPPDIEIAQKATLQPIEDVAARAGILPSELEYFGPTKAKVLHKTWDRVKNHPDGKLILVTAMTATRFGEGKTVTSIGLSQAFHHLGLRALVGIRQPSLGPVFGMKGGAAGGGYAQVLPMEEINLHFTGDFHAITSAHNLLAACIDNTVHFGNKLDLERISWRRVLDLCDRQLRRINAGLGGKTNGWPHETGFDITASSEIMACVTLAEDLNDLETRLERIIIGYRTDESPVYAKEVGCVGAMMALLKDAIKPNIVQTVEGTPALIHGGPFANIAHGCSSVSSTRLGLKLSDYFITEAGFAADLGAEKFFNIKCRQAGLTPNTAVLVVSCRALRAHGLENGADWHQPNSQALLSGLANAQTHLENLRKFGVPVVIAANRFTDDPIEELDLIREFAENQNAGFAISEVAALGGEGGVELANEVIRLCNSQDQQFKFLYDTNQTVLEKIETIAREIYRADGVDYDMEAKESLERIEKNNLNNLPVCMAKTQLSISDNPKLMGSPRNWRLQVRDIRISNGAGFLVVLAGKMLLMPGMPEHGAFEKITLDDQGMIQGLA
jgi:formate--tetrahydrofolate ligase